MLSVKGLRTQAAGKGVFFAMPSEYPTETEVARAALAFAEALTRSDWSKAHAILTPRLRNSWQPTELQREYNAMTSYWDNPATSVELVSEGSEWVYVAIRGPEALDNEAVYVRVVCADSRWLIDDIVWGRP